MESKEATTPRNRLDAIDAERFETMLASQPFALFIARVAAELERARTDCETLESVQRAQGRVAALRTVLELPKIMTREMKKANEH